MTDKPPSIDQDGKMINPHNPDFITKVPWYLGNHGPTLKHHNIQKKDHVLTLTEADEILSKKIEEQRKAALSANKTVYRKGACKNCGAMTHNEKNCLDRPRSSKKAAWKSGLDIAPDEVIVDLENYGKVNYAAKRDQWKGFDTEEYKEVLERHERLEDERKKQFELEKEQRKQNKQARKEEKKRIKEEKIKLGGNSAIDYSSSESESDGEVINEEFIARDDQARDFQDTMAPQGGIGGNGMRVTVRNLRIREDTPKYLRNLALDSAFYDPKSRSMRSNPFPDQNPEDLPFAGDNFVRYSGDTVKLAQNQIVCWEMQARGENVDVISNPSQAEFLQREIVAKKHNVEEDKKRAIIEKYLGDQKIESLDPRLRLGQTEAYIEYTKDGRVANAPNFTNVSTKTKYEEDVFTNNHITVFGSFYDRASASWGYACCCSMLKNSYCTGAKGRDAYNAALKAMSQGAATTIPTNQQSKTLPNEGGIFSEKDTKIEDKSTEKKRKYNSMGSAEVGDDEMEAYRLKKSHHEDPMANYVDNETPI